MLADPHSVPQDVGRAISRDLGEDPHAVLVGGLDFEETLLGVIVLRRNILSNDGFNR